MKISPEPGGNSQKKKEDRKGVITPRAVGGTIPKETSGGAGRGDWSDPIAKPLGGEKGVRGGRLGMIAST